MFNEANAVEEFILDRMVRLGWTYVFGPDLPRMNGDVLLESVLTEALCSLIPRLPTTPPGGRGHLQAPGRHPGSRWRWLVRANEELMPGCEANGPCRSALTATRHDPSGRLR